MLITVLRPLSISWAVVGSLLVALLGGDARAAPFRQRSIVRIDSVDASKPPNVRLYVTDLDAKGAPITDRKEKSYRLLVDGVPQTGAAGMQRFFKLGEPLAVTLVIQVSPALRSVLNEAANGAKRLVKALPQGSKVGLVAYTDVVVKEVKPTKADQVVSAIDDLRIREEAVEVQLLDAIRDALEGLSARGLPDQKVIVVLSDGLNAKLNFRDFTQLGRRAKEKGVRVLSLGFAPLEPGGVEFVAEFPDGFFVHVGLTA